MTYKSQGGPRTQQGKATSSKNATKLGVYTNTLMPGESQEEIDELIEAFREAYGSEHVEVEMMSRNYTQTLLKSQRLDKAEIAFINAQMHMQETRKEFCLQACISPLLWDEVPDWFFCDDEKAKAEAMQCGLSMFEAMDLKKHYSLQLSQSARIQYPNLWKEVMGPQAINPKQSLGERLQVAYSTGNPLTNLQAYVEDCKQRHKYELMWVTSWRRYEAVIDGLKAKAMLDVCSRPDWFKVENSLHKRRMEITQTLMAMRKLKALEVAASNVIEVQSATSLTIDAACAVSKGDNVVSHEEHELQTPSSDER